jgi:hypothetical protein
MSYKIFFLLVLLGISFIGCSKVGFNQAEQVQAAAKSGEVEDRVPENDFCVSDDHPVDDDSADCRPVQGHCPEDEHLHERGTWGICFLSTSNQSREIGYSDSSGPGSRILVVEPGIVRGVCMPQEACLNQVNTYLNLTGGTLSGAPGIPPAQRVQYTSWVNKNNGICQHGSDYTRRNDGNIENDIRELVKRATGS